MSNFLYNNDIDIYLDKMDNILNLDMIKKILNIINIQIIKNQKKLKHILNEDINEYKFDKLYAEENIRYIDINDAPRLKEKPMLGVKKIKFQSDLTGIKSLNQFDEDSFYSNLYLQS